MSHVQARKCRVRVCWTSDTKGRVLVAAHAKAADFQTSAADNRILLPFVTVGVTILLRLSYPQTIQYINILRQEPRMQADMQ